MRTLIHWRKKWEGRRQRGLFAQSNFLSQGEALSDWTVSWRDARLPALLETGSRRRIAVITAVVAAAVALCGALSPAVASSAPANGRAWELVTFSAPSSAQILALTPLGSGDDAVIYHTLGPLPGTDSGALVSTGRALRGPTGWSTTPIGLPYTSFTNEIFAQIAPVFPVAYSNDLHTTLWLTSVPMTPAGPPEEQLGLYRQVGDGPLQFIAHIGEGLTIGYSGFIGMSSDGRSVVFTTKEHLLPGDAGRIQGESVYEWNESGLRLLDVESGGGLLSSCGSTVSSSNGMSLSAQRVFFTHPAQAACGVKRVYLRDSANGTLTEASASRCTRIDCNAAQNVTFAGATRDGGSVYLVTAQQLTNDDQDTGRDLYRYDVDSEQLSLLSGGSPVATGEVKESVVYPSDDGTQVYFRADGVMIAGELTAGEKLMHAGGGGMTLVADAAFPAQPTVQVSANGDKALFVSASKIVIGDTDEKQDTYLYDANSDVVTRISASPSAGNGSFDANVTTALEVPEFDFGNRNPFYALDASGARAVFATAEPLVPEDTNATGDVYEWRDGQLGLVSAGTSEFESSFGGISRSGDTVIFGTTESLVGGDRDGGDIDLYAARVGGGFPDPPVAPACDIASCPRSSRSPLVRPAPASAKAPRQERRRRLRLLRIRSTAGRNAIGRRAVLLLRVPVPGLVSASVWIRRKGKRVPLARGRAGAIRPGRLRLRVHMTAAGRRHVGARRIRARLTISEGGAVPLSRRVRLSLSGGR